MENHMKLAYGKEVNFMDKLKSNFLGQQARMGGMTSQDIIVQSGQGSGIQV